MKIPFGGLVMARMGASPEAAKRATTTMVDQCVASASNFAVGVAVARITGVIGFGAFSLAYTCWILLNTLHRSLITDPMAIFGDMRQEERDKLLRRGVAAELVLGLAATSVIAAIGAMLLSLGERAFGVGLLAVAPWATVLDLQDYWRWIGFMQGRPRQSLANDLVFNAVQAVAFAVVVFGGQRSVFAVVSAWGIGAAMAALYGFRQFSVRPSLRGGVAFLRLRLSTSRWLAGERTVSWGAGQIYLILAGALLGPAALGGLKAAQTLVSGPSSILIHAGGSFGLPEASRKLAESGWKGLVRVSRWVMSAGVVSTIACGVVVVIAAGKLLRLLYGPAFGTYATTARIFVVSSVLAAFAIGPILTLVTTARTRSLFIAQLARLATSVTAIAVLSATHGVVGVASASVIAAAASLVALLYFQPAARRSVENSRGAPSSAANPVLAE